MLLMDKSTIRDKLNSSQEVIIGSMVLALTLMFVSAFQRVVTKYLPNGNFFGLDSDVFVMLSIGIVLAVLASTGLTKKKSLA